LNVRSTCLVLGLSLVGLSAVMPASAQQTSPAAADQTTQASAAATPAPPQDQAPAATPAATPAPAPTWSIGPIDFSGTIDGYYSWNTEHPASKTNELYNFNIPTNTFSLNMAKLAMSHSPDPVGFEFDLMFGNIATQIGSASGSDSFFDKNVEQAYVSLKPAKAKGFEIDFGKFVTSAGAEVIESYSNWNYSRSLLFSWAIPYFHFGLRTSWPMGKHLTAGAQVVNGWNNDFSGNSRATLGLNVMATYSKWSLMEDWYGGPDNEPTATTPGSTMGWRHLFDTVLTVTPSSKFSAYVNYDYGQNRNYGESFSFVLPSPTKTMTAFPNNSLSRWQGIAAALHFQPTSKWAFTPRFEVFDDPNGFAMNGVDNPSSLGSNGINSVPIRQTVKEITVTGEYKILEGLLWRAEYRYDWSNEPFFIRGIGSDSVCTGTTVAKCAGGFGLQNSKDQNTLTIAFIGFFGPKR
jgi:Putative beta-barrel porin-2, OmpL-like. bbp2